MRLDDEASHICPHAGRGRPGTVARILSRRTRIADRGDALQSGPRCVGCRGGSKGIFMRLVRLRAPGGLENLKLVEGRIESLRRLRKATSCENLGGESVFLPLLKSAIVFPKICLIDSVLCHDVVADVPRPRYLLRPT